ncbi:metal ABC transporter substrate-binding protein [Blastococcus haudaquaticus]|uniref:Zinc transport system substrate-binding protein n=1 Tax=Blastococcus haudaquaticus TaxID=1938745 RepID=A0A286H354_9ACTN|nr:metal ABC transporter substrate-binding protein [Blastococcus haudaquaticus]SOE02215.1 zinc transport system substrate-binding protein [Blastococcus haudaquaticus]
MNISVPRRSALAAATASLLLLAGCGGSDEAGEASTGGDRLTVVAGFYPLEWAASRVGGDQVEVSSLTAPGAEPHDLELTPQDVAGVSDADLLVYLSGFQSAVDEAAESQAGDHSWDAAEAANLSLTSGDHDHEHGEEEHSEDEHAEEEHAEEEHAEEEHAEGEESPDPHFWLDPTRLADVGDALAEQLTDLDPDGAETYAQNAASLREDLESLDQEMSEGLGACTVDTLVTSHDAFGYLADRYGLEVVGISGLSPSTEPSADQLAEISTLVRERGVTTVYTETLVDPSIAETVASEAGVQTAVLDPLEGLTDESAGDDYLAVMRANLATLQEGQSCS